MYHTGLFSYNILLCYYHWDSLLVLYTNLRCIEQSTIFVCQFVARTEDIITNAYNPTENGTGKVCGIPTPNPSWSTLKPENVMS